MAAVRVVVVVDGVIELPEVPLLLKAVADEARCKSTSAFPIDDADNAVAVAGCGCCFLPMIGDDLLLRRLQLFLVVIFCIFFSVILLLFTCCLFYL